MDAPRKELKCKYTTARTSCPFGCPRDRSYLMCHYFMGAGYCGRGNKCWFRHSRPEGEPAEMNAQPPPALQDERRTRRKSHDLDRLVRGYQKIVMLDIHNTTDNQEPQDIRDFVRDMAHHRLPYGILSMGPSHAKHWIAHQPLHPLLRDAKLILLNTAHPSKKPRPPNEIIVTEDEEASMALKAESLPPVPVRHVKGSKGECASLLPIPVILLDDRRDCCDEVRRLGQPGSDGIPIMDLANGLNTPGFTSADGEDGPRGLYRWIGEILTRW